MIIYIEVVLFENFVIDILLLWLVEQSINEKIKCSGLILSGLFGAGFALFSPLIKLSEIIAIVIKISVEIIMCILLNLNFKKLLLKTILFMLYTFAFGGCMLALFSFLGVSTTQGIVFGYNSNIPIGAIFACSIILFLCFYSIIKKFYTRRKIVQLCLDVKITLNHKEVNLQGFLDSGNTLDTKQGKPIIIIDNKHLKKWFNIEERLSFILNNTHKLNLQNKQMINIQSIAGNKRLFVFDASKCIIGTTCFNVAVGFYQGNIFKKGFDVILNSKMLEVLNA